MSSERGGSKADTLVKVVLVFFISLLSFSVGTFVGKQVSDSDHRRMALEGEYKADRSVASTDAHDGAAVEGEHSDKISEKEVESLTEEFVNKEKAAQDTATADAHSAEAAVEKSSSVEADTYKTYARGTDKAESAPETDAHSDTVKGKAPPAEKAEDAHAHAPAKSQAAAVEKVAEKVANNQAPTDGMAEPRNPASTLPSVASSAVGKFTVQVASYADENEAKNHAAGLKGKGWNAFYLPANVSGKTWYRVLVGLFNNDKSAKEFRAQFMKETSSKSAIVQKIVQ